MLEYSDIVMFFAGNGFTDEEAVKISTGLITLSDPDKLWLEGISYYFARDEEPIDYDPQNDWQDSVVQDLKRMSDRQRKCYFLYEIKGEKPISIQKSLGISSAAMWNFLEKARYKLIANKKIEVTNEMLGRLNGKAKECYHLHEKQGMSIYAIAKELGVQQSTVRGYIRTAKLQLYRYSEVGVK